MYYYLHQILTNGDRWTSEPIFGDSRQAAQNVLAGFIMGQPRWAVRAGDGALLYGLDARGTMLTRVPTPERR